MVLYCKTVLGAFRINLISSANLSRNMLRCAPNCLSEVNLNTITLTIKMSMHNLGKCASTKLIGSFLQPMICKRLDHVRAWPFRYPEKTTSLPRATCVLTTFSSNIWHPMWGSNLGTKSLILYQRHPHSQHSFSSGLGTLFRGLLLLV